MPALRRRAVPGRLRATPAPLPARAVSSPRSILATVASAPQRSRPARAADRRRRGVTRRGPSRSQPVELPRAPRPAGWPTLAALAIATGLAAIGLGAWSVLSEARSSRARRSTPRRAVAGGPRRLERGALPAPRLGRTDRARRRGAGDAVARPRRPRPVARRRAPTACGSCAPGSATPVGDAAFDASSPVVALERRIPPGTRSRSRSSQPPTGPARRARSASRPSASSGRRHRRTGRQLRPRRGRL